MVRAAMLSIRRLTVVTLVLYLEVTNANLRGRHHHHHHNRGKGLPSLAGHSVLMTFHGGEAKHDVNEVYVYDLASGKRSEVLMKHQNSVEGNARNLRGLEWNPHTRKLYVAQAYKHDGCVYTLDLSDGKPRAGRLIQQGDQQHTYGLALLNQRRWLLTSNQNTGDVSLYDAGDGTLLVSSYITLTYDDASPRGIAVDEERRLLFLAERFARKVSCWSLDYNDYSKPPQKLFEIDVDRPIGVTYDNKSRRLFVSSYARHKKHASVRRFHVSSTEHPPRFEAEYKPPHGKLGHPTSSRIVYLGTRNENVFGGEGGAVVLVLGQEDRALYAFDAASTQYLGTIVSNLPDHPEDLLVLPTS
eukprot:TRINITY_DN2289_c0_g1_i2.p1 TRINITY_DN2289_c0_g1~~TRINITY_DN2289_c0_g1_i2.p1  ORF type:complete len:365 (-),score=57.79 TRINITY_DN2289_c0_g1_i2:295-1365(-)